MMKPRYWSSKEDAMLRRLWAEGLPSVLIAKRLNRATGATRTRANFLGLKRRDDRARVPIVAEPERQYVRQKENIKPIYARSLAERIANIRGHFARLSDRLDAWGAETDRLARDMGFA